MLPGGSAVGYRVVQPRIRAGSSVAKSNKQVQDVMSDLVNQRTRNTLA